MASAELEARPHAVYVIYGSEGEALYVGFTRDPEQRLKQHQAWRRRYGKTTHTVEWHPTRLDARIAEANLIRKLHPSGNSKAEFVWY